MFKKATALLLTLAIMIGTLSAITITASAANNSRQLMVSGNHLVFVDEPTKTVRLTGVNVPGGEWTGTPGVEKLDRSVTWAIDNWKANIIRLPVSVNGWTGNYSYVYDGGNSYRNYIDQVIGIASEKGAYVILDFHHYKSFEKEAYINFWKEAAVRYKNNPTVLFGILNEPHSTSWDVWRNGDGASVYGHQYVVETIRDLGAKNIIVAAGLDWGYKLGAIVDGYALVDQGKNNNAANAGHGIMYDTHIYPWKGYTSNWDANVGAARKIYPVLVGECGWDIGTINEIAGKNPQPGDPLYHDKWVPELLAWFDDDTTYGTKINYTGYCMHPSSAPQLITKTDANGNEWKNANYSYTPSEYWGAYLVPHMAEAVATRYGTISDVNASTIRVVDPKTTYTVGESFNYATGYLDVSYTDGSNAIVDLNDPAVTITGFDSNSATESQTITVGYGSKTVTYTIAIVDEDTNSVAKEYLELDFEDAAYQQIDGVDNYAVIETTNKATGNKIGVNFYNYNDTNRYQVYTDSTSGSKYVATKGRKTSSAFDFRPEENVSDNTNKIYVDMNIKRISYNIDDPVSVSVTDDSGNVIFTINYTQNCIPTLIASQTYGTETADSSATTVTYPNNGDWRSVRAIIDLNSSTFELYQGASFDSLSDFVSDTKTFNFKASATNVGRITNYGVANRKGSLGFDDVKIYTVGEGGSGTPTVTLSSISASNPKTEYSIGDTFVAPTVMATYSDGSTKEVTGATFSGYNFDTSGSQTVTVSYGSKKSTYTINVEAPEKVVSSITVSNAKTSYVWGDTFVEPTVTAKYTDSFYADEVVTGATFTGYDMKSVRTHTVRVIYGGKATTYSITVSVPSQVISSISVSNPKVDYLVGETFMAPPIIVKYTSDYYASQNVSGGTYTGYNLAEPGTQTVNVAYSGFKTGYQITVSASDLVLESIAVSGQKTSYNIGDAFVAPTVTATYSDGSTKTVVATFTGYDMTTAGTQTVTATFEGKTTT
ncbi:MAG: cellulase family glycosylhydrolase, partial [Eubacteriales bacterium]|nr:cellulase family glycosylhydrolase [Eubacteriales bacterium]